MSSPLNKRSAAFAKRLAARQRRFVGPKFPPRPAADSFPRCPRCQQPITSDRCYLCADLDAPSDCSPSVSRRAAGLKMLCIMIQSWEDQGNSEIVTFWN
jgi:hypothetical protein